MLVVASVEQQALTTEVKQIKAYLYSSLLHSLHPTVLNQRLTSNLNLHTSLSALSDCLAVQEFKIAKPQTANS